MVELLVVTALVGILAALLLPALSRARAKSRAAVCLGHLRQLGQAAAIYAGDYRVLPTDAYPGYLLWNGVDYLLYGRLVPVCGASMARLFYCPAAELFPIADPATGAQNLGVTGRVTAGNYYARSEAQGAPTMPSSDLRALLVDYQDPPTGAWGHPDGVNAMYSDGSVRFVRVGRDWGVNVPGAWATLDAAP